MQLDTTQPFQDTAELQTNAAGQTARARRWQAAACMSLGVVGAMLLLSLSLAQAARGAAALLLQAYGIVLLIVCLTAAVVGFGMLVSTTEGFALEETSLPEVLTFEDDEFPTEEADAA
ncbi:MAG: hypothetical protein KDA58_05240 [Planctomycetaceae bacterium]|nr:hypothetical protein [Planctomycetaceae bacterium]